MNYFHSVDSINLNTDFYITPISAEKSENKESIFNFTGSEENSAAVNKTREIIAHRGYSETAPENTLPAFISAAKNGYTTVECDIEWTKDSVPVILHDSTINRTARTSDGKKLLLPRKCSNYTFDELKQFDFGLYKGADFKGTEIPSFSEMLSCCKDYGMKVYVELKENSDFDVNKAKILLEQAKEADVEKNITWISFNSDYLKLISDLQPDARLGFLYKKKPDERTIETLKNLSNGNNEVFLDIKASKMSEKFSRMLKDAGYTFEAWTVNDIDEIDELMEMGCKGITTDNIKKDEFNEFLENADYY